MGTTMSQDGIAEKPDRRQQQGGFSLIEVMIAIVVMTVGLLAVIASFATAIAATESAQEDLIARHKALDAMESIYTARNSQQIPFAAINNMASGGIFASGAQPLLCAGPGWHCRARAMTCAVHRPSSGAACPNGGVGVPGSARA